MLLYILRKIPWIALGWLLGCGTSPVDFDCSTCRDGAEYCFDSRMCLPLIAVGDRCDYVTDREPCLPPGQCNNVSCAAYPLEGEVCSPSSAQPCAEGLDCVYLPANSVTTCERRGRENVYCRSDETCDDGLACRKVHQYGDASVCVSNDWSGKWFITKLPQNADQFRTRTITVPSDQPFTLTLPAEEICTTFPSNCNPGSFGGACGAPDVTLTITPNESGAGLALTWPEFRSGNHFLREGGTSGDVSNYFFHGVAGIMADGRNDCSAGWETYVGGIEFWMGKCFCDGRSCVPEFYRDGRVATRCL